MNKPSVSIIILNWNGWKDTIECLESLYRINYPEYNIIVVDNGSKDGSIKKIKEYCKGKIKPDSDYFHYNPENKPIHIFEYEEEALKNCKNKKLNSEKRSNLPSSRKITIIKNKENYGYAAGNNIGARYILRRTDHKYMLLLNNDTVVDKNFLNELVQTAENRKKAGLLGPKKYFYKHKGRQDIIDHAGAKQNIWKFSPEPIGHLEMDKGQHDKEKIVDYVQGSCLLAKREMVEEVGLLDPKFFAYREENDWAIRAQKLGWKSVYVPSSKVWHKKGCSSLSLRSYLGLARNRFLFIKKHAKTKHLLSFFLYFFGFDFLKQSYYLLVKQTDPDSFLSFLKGVKDGLSISP